jgi:hypothetical protein
MHSILRSVQRNKPGAAILMLPAMSHSSLGQPTTMAESSFWSTPAISLLVGTAMVIVMTALLGQCAVQIQKDYAAFVS